MLTKDIIASSIVAKEQQALKTCIEADSFKQIENTETEATIYEAIKNDKVVGHAFSVKKNGYGGDVSVIIGIIDGKVSAIEITDVANETPGLGQNAKNDSFKDKFKGIQNTDEVSAMTGATITSNAVKNAVNEALTLYNILVRGVA